MDGILPTHKDAASNLGRFILAAIAALALLPGDTTPTDPAAALRPLTDVPASRHIDVLTRPETLNRVAV